MQPVEVRWVADSEACQLCWWLWWKWGTGYQHGCWQIGVVLADLEADELGWCMDVTPVAGNRRSEVVVAMANVVVVVAEDKCRVQGCSGPDARALRRIEMRRGVPG